jgi:serine/threonine protein kinase
MAGGAKALFSRSKNDASLEDFKILKMIGKGTFGKVYLVEQKNQPGKLFAMKCIRKDIILENEQMDNI